MRISPNFLFVIILLLLSNNALAQSDSSEVDPADSTSAMVQNQLLNDTLLIEFIKGNRTNSSDSTLFDIVSVSNTTQETYSGKLSIDLPNNWSLISQKEVNISLAPGASYYFPLRIAMPDELTGGYSYIVSAVFSTDNEEYKRNLYITIPRKSKWGIELMNQNIYFNSLYDYVEYDYHLFNYGNAEEIIKVEYEIGKMLEMPDLDNTDNKAYYVIPAHTDTVIKHKIKYRKGLSDFEEERYSNNFRESTVLMQASTSEKSEKRRVSVSRLDSEYDNHKGIYNYQTPLTLEWQTYNLLSGVSPRYNIRAYGKVLFNKARQLDYHVAALSLPYDGNYANVSFSKNAFFRILYSTPTSRTLFSSNIGGYSLLNSYGMGISYKQELAPNMRAEVIVTRDRFFPITSGSLVAEYDFLPELSGRLGLGYYDDADLNHSASSILLGSRFVLFKKHRFDIDLAFSNNIFKPNAILAEEEEKVGFSYRFRYNVSLPKFNFSIYSLNKSFNYFRNSNTYVNTVNGSYVFDQKNRINLNFNANSYLLDIYPYRFLRLDSWVRNLFGQLLYIRPLSSKLFLNVGPEVRYNYRDIYVVSDDYNTQLENFSYGAYLALTYKLGAYSSITPNMRIGGAQTNYRDPLNSIDIQTDLQFAIRVGINYAGKYLRVLAYYQEGPLNISDQAIISTQVLPTQSSYQVRPYYERYFFDKVMRLSAFVNYIYLMPSRRELFNWSVMADIYLEDGWEFGVSNNLYSNKYVNTEQSLIANKGLNIFIRAKKSFNIQQPRVKFYSMDLVYFKDLNGNGVKDKEELPIPNVKTVVERLKDVEVDRNLDHTFVAQHLVSDPDGHVTIENIPDGNYELNHVQLMNSDNLFFVYGSEQEVILNSDQTIYVPLSESYKIKGKIVLDRDPNSKSGIVDISEIRISAISDEGETFFALSDDYGQFTIHVPPGKNYTVSVNQVLGEFFSLEKDEKRVEMIDVKTVNIDFFFIEERRGVNIEGENFYNFDTESNDN